MKYSVHHTIVATCLVCSLTGPSFAEAPVVDESENYALFDEQLAAAEQPDTFMSPVVSESSNTTGAYEPSEEPQRIALADEESSSELYQDSTNMLGKMQNLQQELNELRGQMEVQTHELQALKQQQLNFYNDLDTRLRHNTTAQTDTESDEITAANDEPVIETPLISTGPRGNPADEQISYLAAYELIKSKEFDKAVMAMKGFINRYPQGGYTANAHYWLGELYMVKKSFPDAIQQFETVLKTFPTSSKTSASSLKIGYALAASGKKSAARQHLQAVIRDYPDTHAAELAASKLETLNS